MTEVIFIISVGMPTFIILMWASKLLKARNLHETKLVFLEIGLTVMIVLAMLLFDLLTAGVMIALTMLLLFTFSKYIRQSFF